MSRSSATTADTKAGAKKRFGQNFLQDRHVVARILEAVRPQPGDRLVEIGPGRGALTSGLVSGAGSITAIEIDRDLIPTLQARFGEGLSLIEQDVLTVDFAGLSAQLGGPLRIVGNLPYNISSPILFMLLPLAHCVLDQTFMLQQEVVERMVALHGSKRYGRLSVMLQARYEMTTLMHVPPAAFSPAPAVNSAVVLMWPLSPEQVFVKDWAVYEALVAAAFSTRRKMIRNTLSGYLDRLDLEAAGVRPTQRPEEVSVASFVALANQLVN
jgi:16S rRNA (adenine1518-N6/adenine1519-N6)-dimethyltransferase